MLLETVPGRIANMIQNRYQQLGPISFFTLTLSAGNVRLDVYCDGKLPQYKSFRDQRFNRACLRQAKHFAEQLGETWKPNPTFILVDQRHRFYHFCFAPWPDVRDSAHPAQRLISAESQKDTRRAFLAARPEMSESVLVQAGYLAQASQHRFMDRLLLEHQDGSFETPREALLEALEHEAQLPN